jgi:hydrogenase/urease accessory protein HupE
MHVHVEIAIAGWWDGVLHPMQSADLLITLLLVGVLGGLAVRAARSTWTLPASFVLGLAAFGLLGLVVNHPLNVDPLVVGSSMVLAVLLFVHPRRLGTIAPVVAFSSGALYAIGHSVDGSGDSRPLGYIAGFVFTSGVLLAVGDIVGAAIGHSSRARSAVVGNSRSADMDDPALI